jgi:hypothetical protein
LPGEFLNSEKFCLSAEFHFTRKGERNPNHLAIVETINTSQGLMYDYKYLTDRFYYLSLQLLPKYRFVVTPTKDNIYLISGPKFDLIISNTNSANLVP